MQPITAALLVAAVGCTQVNAVRFAEPLAETCRLYEINTTRRLAAFLAQVGHESGSFGRTTENLNYSAEGLLATWPSRFTRELAAQLARKPEEIANRVYGGRMGNTKLGDGWRYRGHGLIQCTGHDNHEAMTELLREVVPNSPDFVAEPERLAESRWAALSAGAYWDDHELNRLADAVDFDRITTRINGAQVGKADRRDRFARALKALA